MIRAGSANCRVVAPPKTSRFINSDPAGALSTVDELANRAARELCNPVNYERHGAAGENVRVRPRYKGNLRHNFRDCYDRVLQLKAYDADNRSRRARPRENTGARDQ
jgi:hypothetical protein